MDEWYKVAYYEPVSGTYFDYPTGSDSAPTTTSGGTTAGTAVYLDGVNPNPPGPADVNNAGGLSSYEVMALGGKVWEWQEAAPDFLNNSTSELRAFRGGAWNFTSYFLQSSNRAATSPRSGTFRVAGAAPASAMVPEPSTILPLWLIAGLVGMNRKRRRLSSP